jgi:hypothetical protein
MKLLLDTNILLCLQQDDSRIKQIQQTVKRLISQFG